MESSTRNRGCVSHEAPDDFSTFFCSSSKLEMKIPKHTAPEPHLHRCIKPEKSSQLKKASCTVESNECVAVELTGVCSICLNNCCMAGFEFTSI